MRNGTVLSAVCYVFATLFMATVLAAQPTTKEFKEDKKVHVTTISETDADKDIKIKDSQAGDFLTVKLKASAIKRWRISKYNETILKAPKEPIVIRQKLDINKPLVGVPEQERFVFTILRTGMTRIEMQCCFGDEVLETKRFRIILE